MLINHLFETPVEDISFHGNWNRNSSFGQQDRKLITNPKAQEKIIQKWINTTIPFNMYFVNSSEAKHHAEVGEVSRNWLYENMPIFYDEMVKAGKITSREFFNDEAINVIFTNNKGSERVPMTAWIIAHRFCHALYRKNGINGGNLDFVHYITALKRYLKNIFELYRYNFNDNGSAVIDFGNSGERNINMIRFFEEIGTMKSARDKKIRTPFEFFCELVAQYLITGHIKFNEAPKFFKGYKNRYYSCKDSDLEIANSDLRAMAESAEDYIATMLSAAVGKVFVM